MEQLWEFLNSHKEIAAGYNKTMQARDHSRRMWETVASALNAQGDGAFKDWKCWCKYWVDYKSKLKKLVSLSRASQQRTRGGPADKKLSEMEENFHKFLLRQDFGSGIPGARVEPFEEGQVLHQAQSDCEGHMLQLGHLGAQMEPFVELQEIQQTDSQTMPTKFLRVSPLPPSLPGPPPAFIDSPTQTPNTSPLHPRYALTTTPRNSPRRRRRRRLDRPTPQSSPRRRRRRRDPGMSAEASRRALIEISKRRADAEDNKNRVLTEKLQLISQAVENNNCKKELQELTLAINNLNKTINSRFPE